MGAVSDTLCTRECEKFELKIFYSFFTDFRKHVSMERIDESRCMEGIDQFLTGSRLMLASIIL